MSQATLSRRRFTLATAAASLALPSFAQTAWPTKPIRVIVPYTPGGFTDQMVQKNNRPPITNEAGNGLQNTRGTLSMARTQDPDSATSQFFINVADNDFLNPGRDRGYAVFGKVTKGMEVVDQIVNSPTTIKQGMRDVPADPVYIKSAKRID